MDMKTVFILTLIVNIVLVAYGFNLNSIDVTGSFFDSVGGNITGVSNETLSSIDPASFVTASANTGDPSASEFKLIDALGVVRSGLSLIASLLVAPMLMAFDLGWPPFLMYFVAVPWTILYWISMIYFIRGLT